MKLKSYKFFIAIMAIAVVFASCSKESNKADDQQSIIQDKTTLKLVSFKQDLFSKSGGSMLSDTAEWYLEGLLNYEQANNTHEFVQVEFTRDTLTWPAGNGEISYSDLQDIYAYINAMAENMALQNGNPEFTYDIIDLRILEITLKNDEQLVEVTLSGGTKGTTPIHLSFGPTDYWYSAGLQGKCGDYIGQCIGRDATTELQDQFTLPAIEPSYFVSISTFYAHAEEYETADNPYGYYMMWAENSNHSNNCLSPGELNYYMSKWDYIKNFNKPENKTFCSVEVINDCFVGSDEDFHTYIIKYGVNTGSPTN